jgi:glutamine synthetase
MKKGERTNPELQMETIDYIAGGLNKERSSFTAQDIITFVQNEGIELLNFGYVGGDGRIKTLSFTPRDAKHLDRILHEGERVDGSSLFKYIDTGASDLYVVPRYSTAFMNPFSEEPALNLLCSYFNMKGEPLRSAPGYIVNKAMQAVKDIVGVDILALGELEYYVVFDAEGELYPGKPQRNYHESTPFVKWAHLRELAMLELARMGAPVKYGHAEVGDVPAHGNVRMEQHEIEFLPEPLDLAADHIVIAKWLLRNFSAEMGATVTYAPKVGIEHAGSGLHVHIDLVKDGKSQLLDASGELTELSLRANFGMLHLAPALTAFGNTVPTSYLRLMPHHEAPTNICWGKSNRSALVRVPLGWIGANGMSAMANPQDGGAIEWNGETRQTLEYRVSDGSANMHQLLAGIAAAVICGCRDAKAIERARELQVEGNLFKDELLMHTLDKLPTCCEESAAELLRLRSFFEADGIFQPEMIDGVAKTLAALSDRDVLKMARTDEEITRRLVNDYFDVA